MLELSPKAQEMYAKHDNQPLNNFETRDGLTMLQAMRHGQRVPNASEAASNASMMPLSSFVRPQGSRDQGIPRHLAPSLYMSSQILKYVLHICTLKFVMWEFRL